MDEERKAWEQKEGESDLWFSRFTRFRLMMFGRSIAAVFQEEETERNREKPRTKPTGDWYEESKKWEWKERAAAYDAHWVEEQDAIIKQEREIALRSGFAIQHRRVQSLDKVLNKLLEMAEDEDKVWIRDVKSIGAGPAAYEAEIFHFNAPLFTLIEKYKASIAAEMGERVKKQQIEMDDKSKDSAQDIQSANEVIEKALEGYPEARLALAEALVELGKASESS